MTQKLLKWLGFGVLFSLLPFLFNGVIFLGVKGHPKFSWYFLWPHGELLIVSAGFAADAVGEVVGVGGKYKTGKICVGCICVLCVAIESFWFAQIQSPASTYDPATITGWSVALFSVTLVNAAICKVLGQTR